MSQRLATHRCHYSLPSKIPFFFVTAAKRNRIKVLCWFPSKSSSTRCTRHWPGRVQNRIFSHYPVFLKNKLLSQNQDELCTEANINPERMQGNGKTWRVPPAVLCSCLIWHSSVSRGGVGWADQFYLNTVQPGTHANVFISQGSIENQNW